MSGLAAPPHYGRGWENLDNAAIDGDGSTGAQALPAHALTSSRAQMPKYQIAGKDVRTLAQRARAGETAQPKMADGPFSLNETSPPEFIPRVRAKEKLLQEWEGRIIAISARKLVARMIDVTAGHHEEREEMEFPLSELTDDDRKIARVGSVFRLEIGWRYDQGSRSRVTRLFLRRVPVWKDTEMRRADEAAKALGDALERDRHRDRTVS